MQFGLLAMVLVICLLSAFREILALVSRRRKSWREEGGRVKRRGRWVDEDIISAFLFLF